MERKICPFHQEWDCVAACALYDDEHKGCYFKWLGLVCKTMVHYMIEEDPEKFKEMLKRTNNV